MKRFEAYFNFINREGKDNLLAYLHEGDYFTAPASSQYHLSSKGGLLEHSLNVTQLMFDISEKLPCNLSAESMAIVGLFHDLGKSTYYGKPNYIDNLLKSGLRSTAKPYETNKDRLAIPHEVASVHMLGQFIRLTEDEAFAIMFHNGLYTPLGYAVKNNETELFLLLHFADMYSSRFTEKVDKL